jgi:hypothetical protein
VIGLLDPMLFIARDEAEIVGELDLILLTCRKYKIELTPLGEYWSSLWHDFGSKLERQLSPHAKRTLQALRQAAPKSDQHVSPLPPNAGTAWRRGFTDLFGAPYLQPQWADRMALAVIRALSSGQETVMFSRRLIGRNLVVHRTVNCTLHENTRWLLHVQPCGVGHRHVLCVYHPRNLSERWTTRFDWRLPSISDGARYPFFAPDHWWKGSTKAVRTICSKPAWVDARGNGWARPNINNGAGYHWDVFIQDLQTQQEIGVNQINVVEFGAPHSEGCPGSLHHTPSAKQSSVQDKGWECP